MTAAAFLLVAIVLIMATFDPHRIEDGRSTTLLTKAAYPKVYVHLVGGGMLYALFVAGGLSARAALVWTALAGVLYEVVQWLNPRGRWRGGVYTIAEALAVALGGLMVMAWGIAWR